SRRLPAVPLRSGPVPPLPDAAEVHAERERDQGGDAACVGGQPGADRSAPVESGGQAHLQAKKGDGGAKLRRRQTTARPPLCQDARPDPCATAVPAGRHRTEHQENRPAAEQNRAENAPFTAPGASIRLYRPAVPLSATRARL